MPNLIHTPEGVRDIFGRECDKKRYLERRIEKLFRSYGYQSIETPTFEFFDVFAREVGTVPSKELYKFFDREGNTLVLRPDFTPSVARAVSMYFGEETMPLRLCYSGNVFINHSSYQGRLRESTQMGVEFLNDDSPEAEAEILALVISIMRNSGLTRFQVSVGNTGYFRALAQEAGMPEDVASQLRQLLSAQNRFGAQEMIARMPLGEELRQRFNRMPEQFGDHTVLENARIGQRNPQALAALDRLDQIWRVLQNYGFADYITFDLGMVSDYQYYTGIIFQAFTYGTGDALIKGGRYNRMIEHFGKKAPAVGFTTEIDALLTALDRQGVRLPVEDIKTMVLYPVYLENLAARFAADQRSRGLDVACVRFEAGHILDDYRKYGSRNQFGGIIYFRSVDEVYAINLKTAEVETLDMSYWTGGHSGQNPPGPVDMAGRPEMEKPKEPAGSQTAEPVPGAQSGKDENQDSAAGKTAEEASGVSADLSSAVEPAAEEASAGGETAAAEEISVSEETTMAEETTAAGETAAAEGAPASDEQDAGKGGAAS